MQEYFSFNMKMNDYYANLEKALLSEDPKIHSLIAAEIQRQNDSLLLVAAQNMASKAVLAALGTELSNKTVEGFIGERYHGGCEVIDKIEACTIQRAKIALKAQYANVQPHSGSQANQIVIFSVLKPKDTIMGMKLDHGGHLTHGSKASMIGNIFNIVDYGVNKKTKVIDYDEVKELARKHKPKLIICGASSYPREIDFKKFRDIADNVGAYLMADISHIMGLVIGGQHQSPIPFAHFVTSSTYKAGGPRGGVIFIGNDVRDRPSLEKMIDRATFPFMQGTPHLNNICAKAVFFKEAKKQKYFNTQLRIVDNARALSGHLVNKNYDVLTGGTDNHMVLIDITSTGHTGKTAQEALEACGIITNKNVIPYDKNSPAITSGIRLGTSIIGRRGVGVKYMATIAGLLDEILKVAKPISKSEYELDPEYVAQKIKEVKTFVSFFDTEV